MITKLSKLSKLTFCRLIINRKNELCKQEHSIRQIAIVVDVVAPPIDASLCFLAWTQTYKLFNIIYAKWAYFLPFFWFEATQILRK
jgi:hypothetical protein